MNSLCGFGKPVLTRRSSAELPAGNSAAYSLFADPNGSPHNISAQPTSRADHAFFQNRQVGLSWNPRSGGRALARATPRFWSLFKALLTRKPLLGNSDGRNEADRGAACRN